MGKLAFAIMFVAFGATLSAWANETSEIRRSLDQSRYTALDRWAAQLIKHQPKEEEACNKSRLSLEENEACAVNQAITVWLRDNNWCETAASPTWHKCSFTIAEQLFNMEDDCRNAIEEMNPSQAKKFCYHLLDQAVDMCRDINDAPMRVCWDTTATISARAETLEMSMETHR